MKRKRFTKNEIEILDEQIIAVLKDDYPQSVRHVFYRMTNPRLEVPVEKTQSGYDRVQRRCLALRREGKIPYKWVSDSTRRGSHVTTYQDGGDFLERVAGLYRSQLWRRDDPHVEVWCESDSIAGVLTGLCRELSVSLYPTRGFPSATLCYQAAIYIDQLNKAQAIILYVGDYDPSGVLIPKTIDRELRRHLETPLEFRRLAINPEQIQEYDLPTKPPKAEDRRSPDIQSTVEAEAMPAGELRRIVRDEVEAYLPDGALAAAKMAEESEREGLRLLSEGIKEYGLDEYI